MTFNTDKTSYVIFHSPNKKLLDTIKIKFGKRIISRTNSVKFLGVLLDEIVNWTTHLVELSKKLARTVGIFYKLRHYVPLDALKSIYFALFYPFLTYGIVVWGATHDNYLRPVLTSQKKVIRAITCKHLSLAM